MDTWKRSGGLLTGDISLSAVTCGQGEESSFEMSCFVDSFLFRWGFLKNLLLSSFLLCTSVKKLFCFICSRVRISHLRQDKLDEGYLIERTNKKSWLKRNYIRRWWSIPGKSIACLRSALIFLRDWFAASAITSIDWKRFSDSLIKGLKVNQSKSDFSLYNLWTFASKAEQ